MAGSGYNIPISLSYASTFTPSESIGGNATFVFSSPDTQAPLYNDQTQEPTSPATATSAAAEGNLAQSAPNSTSGAGGLGLTSTGWLWLAVAAIAAFVFLRR